MNIDPVANNRVLASLETVIQGVAAAPAAAPCIYADSLHPTLCSHYVAVICFSNSRQRGSC